MNRQGLPGIEELFREQDRLAKKLSQEELNALRRYLQRTVHAECQSVVARMRYLQAAHDVNESQFQRALGTLQKDLQVQQTVAGEFRREFSSLARVLQAREQRYTARQETLIQQVLDGREAVKEAVKARDNLEMDLQQKEKELNQHKDMVVDLEDQLSNHRDCDKVRQQAAQLNTDLLKAKLDNEDLRKELVKLKSKPEPDPKTKPPQQNQVRFLPTVSIPKHGPVTFTPMLPYCTSNRCRARLDLEECRAHFIQKCEEVVYLKSVLSEQKAKSRERCIFRAGPGSGKPSAAVQPLKPAYHREKEFVSSSRFSPAVKSFRLGPSVAASVRKR